ncbi:MAG: sigma-70 family RNA polymerase sigma factor [Ktedonobacteraceae bacterium]
MQQIHREEQQNDEVIACYDRYASDIFTYLCRQVSSPQDAEDILIEVFMAAFKTTSFAHFTPEQQLAWLRRVARNKVIDAYRHHSYFTMLPLEQIGESEDDALLPEQLVVQQEAYEYLYRLLARLSPTQQELIQLRYGDGLRLTEIAAMLNKSEEAVRKMLSRTLHQLRAMYKQAERGSNI